jgi:hypothetical protein
MKRTNKICNRCGAQNKLNASTCSACECEKFAPAWVLAKMPVNRQVSIEITKSDPRFGSPVDRITLSKWWPGGNTSFHIPNIKQWERVRSIIDTELAPRLGWKTARQAVAAVAQTKNGDAKKIGKIFEDRPDIVRKIVEAIDPTAFSKKDFESLGDTLIEISATISSASAGFRDAFLSVVKKLPKQKQRALEDLSLLLEGWSLQAVTNVAQQVRSRLDTIKLFETQIQDERTYEIRGDNSIHRILERSMWLVDERYWILHSNDPLRKFIGAELAKKDKKYKEKRPDFVCGTVGKKLILLELKRPSHVLGLEDLNQLELYVVLAEEYSDFGDCEAYLVGNKKSDELTRRLKYRTSKFKTWTYSDLLQDTKQKYETFLKTVG